MANKVLIIGSGFGGLASALRLRAKKFDVTLIEKHKDLGGRARVFKKNNFVYDGGPTVITAPYLFEELFELFGKNLKDYTKIVPLIMVQIAFDNGESFDYSSDENVMRKEIEKFSKDDLKGSQLVDFTQKFLKRLQNYQINLSIN